MSRNSTLTPLQEAGFGSFVYMCRSVGSYVPCNLFYRQLQKTNFTLQDSKVAPIGIDPVCAIQRASVNGSLGNIANDLSCGISLIFTIYLITNVNRRKAAVGRVELRSMLGIYCLSLVLQLLSAGSFLDQGSIPLVILSALYCGVIVALFWTILANAIITTQVVEDGTPASMIPFFGFSVILFLITTYIGFDTALGFTSIFKSGPPESLKNAGLFVLLCMWPALCFLISFGIMAYIIIRVLQEFKPLAYYVASGVLFISSQLIYFLLSVPLCTASNRIIDSSFLVTILETAAVGVLFLGWRSITEGSWDTQYFPA